MAPDEGELHVVDPAGDAGPFERRPVRTTLRIGVGLRTDPGRVRATNEDALDYGLLAGAPGGLASWFGVADGMGGHRGGRAASGMAIRQVRRSLEAAPGSIERATGTPQPSAGRTGDLGSFGAWMREVFADIHTVLQWRARELSIVEGIGTTLTLLLVSPTHLRLAHVGDSRCYRLREGTLRQLTQDHSWVAEQRRAGTLTADEVRTHAYRNVLTRCLGGSAVEEAPSPEPYLVEESLDPGDRLLLCTDGLHGTVEASEIASTLAEAPTPAEAADRLIESGNAAGGPDNLSALVLFVDAPPGGTVPDSAHRLEVEVIEYSRCRGALEVTAPIAVPDARGELWIPRKEGQNDRFDRGSSHLR